jgi:hypothetical protein
MPAAAISYAELTRDHNNSTVLTITIAIVGRYARRSYKVAAAALVLLVRKYRDTLERLECVAAG